MIFDWVKKRNARPETLPFMLPATSHLYPDPTEQALSFTLYFQNRPEKLRLAISRNSEFMIGRSSQQGDFRPEVDLGPFDGAEMGVSRVHACLERRNDRLLLIDLGSRNLTFHNEEQLQPYEVRLLKNGDRICFGRLLTAIRY